MTSSLAPGDALPDLLGLGGRRRRVLLAGDDQRRQADRPDRLAQVHVADRGAAAGVALRRGLEDHLAHPLDHDRGLGAERLGEPALDHAVGERRHALLARDLDALVPEVLRLHVAGGRAQGQAAQPGPVRGAQQLPDHAAFGEAAEVRALDAEAVEQAERVVDQGLEAVGARRRRAAAVAAAVVAQHPVALRQRRQLRVPHLEPGAERVARAAPPAPRPARSARNGCRCHWLRSAACASPARAHAHRLRRPRRYLIMS